MTTLKDITDEELAAEIKRRAQAKRKIPNQLTPIDWTPVITYVSQGLEHIIKQGDEPSDFAYYISETVLAAIYGQDIFKWIDGMCK